MVVQHTVLDLFWFCSKACSKKVKTIAALAIPDWPKDGDHLLDDISEPDELVEVCVGADFHPDPRRLVDAVFDGEELPEEVATQLRRARRNLGCNRQQMLTKLALPFQQFLKQEYRPNWLRACFGQL